MAPEKWRLLMEKDERDPRFDYRALLKSVSPEIRKELREEVFQRKYAACQTAIAKLRSAISEVAPDDAEAIRSWERNRKVAIVASGGLSHFIVDEEIDRMALDGLLKQDGQKLSHLPLERLMVLGTGEILNWIAAAGAPVDYAPR
jgi:hypothetical protein